MKPTATALALATLIGAGSMMQWAVAQPSGPGYGAPAYGYGGLPGTGAPGTGPGYGRGYGYGSEYRGQPYGYGPYGRDPHGYDTPPGYQIPPGYGYEGYPSSRPSEPRKRPDETIQRGHEPDR